MNSQFADLPGFGPTSAADATLRIEYRWINPHLRDAPLLVFLHEGLGSIAMWKSWPQDLCDAGGLRGLVYSRPGYGRSTPRAHEQPWPGDYLHHQAGAVLPALLEQLGVGQQPVWLIGHSDGASIALLFAAAFAQRTAGAVLMAPHVFVEALSLQGIRAAREAYEHASLRNKLAQYHDDVDSAFWGWNDVWLSPGFASWNIEAALATIACPLLVIQGSDDEYGTLAHMERIAARVADTATLVLPACGHSPHRDCPAGVNAAITGFIARAQSDGARRTG